MSGGSRRLLAALVLGGFAGCVHNPAPRGWRPKPEELPRWTRGAWIVVEGPKNTRTRGELIAIEGERLYVLTSAGLESLPRSTIRRATLTLHDTDADKISLQAFCTLTHGRWLLFTLPMWVIVADGESRTPFRRHPPDPLDSLRKYARFPQGRPSGLEASGLGPRPPSERQTRR